MFDAMLDATNMLMNCPGVPHCPYHDASAWWCCVGQVHWRAIGYLSNVLNAFPIQIIVPRPDRLYV